MVFSVTQIAGKWRKPYAQRSSSVISDGCQYEKLTEQITIYGVIIRVAHWSAWDDIFMF